MDSREKIYLLLKTHNDELFNLCYKHGINNKYQYWLIITFFFTLISPLIYGLYSLIDGYFYNIDGWISLGIKFLIVVVIQILLWMYLSITRNTLNKNIRLKCHEIQQLGYLIVKKQGLGYLVKRQNDVVIKYDYSFYLIGVEEYNHNPDSIDEVLVEIEKYSDTDGISSLLK